MQPGKRGGRAGESLILNIRAAARQVAMTGRDKSTQKPAGTEKEPSPGGRRIPDRSAAFYKVQPYTPSEPRKRGPPPPTRREAALRWEDIRNHRQRGFPLPVVFYLLSRLYSLSFGSVTVMVVPLPKAESTWMVPRWIITACLTMDKPRPVPPTSLDRLLSTR